MLCGMVSRPIFKSLTSLTDGLCAGIVSQMNPFSLKLLLVKVFYHSLKNKAKMVLSLVTIHTMLTGKTGPGLICRENELHGLEVSKQ